MIKLLCLRVPSAEGKESEIAHIYMAITSFDLGIILPVSAEPNQIIGGVSYTISAPLALRQSYSYSWSNWRHPLNAKLFSGQPPL